MRSQFYLNVLRLRAWYIKEINKDHQGAPNEKGDYRFFSRINAGGMQPV